MYNNNNNNSGIEYIGESTSFSTFLTPLAVMYEIRLFIRADKLRAGQYSRLSRGKYKIEEKKLYRHINKLNFVPGVGSACQ